MDDETPDINVESGAVNSTDSSMGVRGQQQQLMRPATTVPTVQAARPVSFVVSRRPLNLLSLRRPVRQYQIVTARNERTPTMVGVKGDINS